MGASILAEAFCFGAVFDLILSRLQIAYKEPFEGVFLVVFDYAQKQHCPK